MLALVARARRQSASSPARARRSLVGRRARELRAPGARLAARARPRLVGLLALVPPGCGRRPAVLGAPGVPHAGGAARHGNPDVARRRGAHEVVFAAPLRALAPRLGVGGGADLALGPRSPPGVVLLLAAAVRRASSTRYRATRSSRSSSPGGQERSSAPGSPARPRGSSAVGVGVALLTLTRPAAQVALLACVLVPLARAAPLDAGASRRRRRASRPRCSRSRPGRSHNAVRYDDLAVARGSKAWVPFFRVAGEVDPANGDASRRLADAVEQRRPDAAAVREPRRRRRGRTSTAPATSR